MMPSDADLIAICQKWLADRNVRQMPLELAIDEFLEAKKKQNVSERYYDSLRKRLNKLRGYVGGDVRVGDISRQDIESFFGTVKNTPINRDNYIRDFRVFFEWAAVEKYAPQNVAAEIQRPTVKRKDPEILAVDQVENMLKGTIGQDRACAALGMFVGVRPEELPKLDWKHIDLERGIVRLPPEITKTNVGRILYLEPNAVAWLRTVRGKGLIFKGDASCLTSRLRLAAGLEKWPQNALRHTFATMHVTAFEDAGRTALMMHSKENPKILFQHYFRSTLKEDALKFWQLYPS
jgi:integrase